MAARPVGQAAVDPMPTPPVLGVGNADVSVDAVQGHADYPELQLLGGGGHPRDTLLKPEAVTDVAVDWCQDRSWPLWNSLRNGEVFRK